MNNCMAESCVPKTDKYRNSSRRLLEASRAFEKTLDKDQMELFEAVQTERTDLETLIQINIYRQGLKFGFELANELTDEKTKDNVKDCSPVKNNE